MARFTVASASLSDLTPACRVLFAHRVGPDRDRHAARCHVLLTAGELDPDGLFVAKDDSGAICGAAIVQPLPGALGLMWPPRAAQPVIEDALVTTACGWLQGHGVKVCQAFAAAEDCAAMASLERHGFRRVTQVSHMRREVDPAADRVEPIGSVWCWECLGEPTAELLAILMATYEGTLDCPELNGTRTAAEVLAGFRQTGTRYGWWYAVERDRDPIGVLLFDGGAGSGALEIGYLGLIPGARGQGIGNVILRFALQLAAMSGYSTLTLSVDVRNEPAMRLYRRHGFAEYDRQDVYLAVWGQG